MLKGEKKPTWPMKLWEPWIVLNQVFFGILVFKCCNSFISLCIRFEEKDLGHEIIQIGVLDCFKKIALMNSYLNVAYVDGVIEYDSTRPTMGEDGWSFGTS